jgi:metal-responsive CopG/Arc/MetJ family transcriptional regulator
MEVCMERTVRVSVVFPRQLWEKVRRVVPAGKRSQMIAEATQREMQRRLKLEALAQARRVGERLKRKYGEIPSSEEEIRMMREERDARAAGLR